MVHVVPETYIPRSIWLRVHYVGLVLHATYGGSSVITHVGLVLHICNGDSSDITPLLLELPPLLSPYF